MSTKYRVQVMTSDAAVLHCLRGLAFYCEPSNKHASVAGVTDSKWQANGEVVTFAFSDETARDQFKWEVDRLLPDTLVVAEIAPPDRSDAVA
jgi:hypothetical protein